MISFIFLRSLAYKRDHVKELEWLLNLKFEKAVYYNYNCSTKCKDLIVCDFQIIDSLNVLANTIEMPGIEVKYKSAKDIICTISQNKFYKTSGIAEGTGCYKPKSAIVFYNSLQKPIASINFSIDCLQIEIINYDRYAVYHKYFYEIGKEKILTFFNKNNLIGC